LEFLRAGTSYGGVTEIYSNQNRLGFFRKSTQDQPLLVGIDFSGTRDKEIKTCEKL